MSTTADSHQDGLSLRSFPLQTNETTEPLLVGHSFELPTVIVIPSSVNNGGDDDHEEEFVELALEDKSEPIQAPPRSRKRLRLLYIGFLVGIMAYVCVTTSSESRKTSSLWYSRNNQPGRSIQKDAHRSTRQQEKNNHMVLEGPSHHNGDAIRQQQQQPTKHSARPTETTTTHASDALQCRTSVVNFVINATDGKDECDGLIKAFEKTCNTDEHADTALPHGRRILQRQNKALVFSTRPRLAEFWHDTQQRVRWLIQTIVVWTMKKPSFVFVEDQVLHEWDNVRYNLEHKDVSEASKKALRQLRIDGQRLHEKEQQHRILSLLEGEDYNNTTTTTTKTGDTAKNMQLPIKGHTVTEKTANDAILLQNADKMIKAANDTIVAREEAAKSKKSISDTVDAVSAVLNDPSSIQARTCCASILNVYTERCSTDEESQVSDQRLFFLVTVMALCGIVKSLIRHFKILWLPEAAGCIIVGVLSGYALDFFPHQDISFDAKYFLRILVPPIIFEAALSIDKGSFRRHLVPIVIYAVIGTLVATLLTAEIVHNGTTALSGWCAPIPYVEALTFGALISSIDPIAVLSVLSNMGMTDTDTIYVLIFGESLLNDGVAIVLFHTLVHFLDETLVIDREVIVFAIFHFFVVAFGSLLVGVASGMMSTLFFWMFHGCSSATVEVLMFFCWALLPYYVCDGIGWSGIVAAVAVGFVMDLHVVGQKRPPPDEPINDLSEHTVTSYDSGKKETKPVERGRRRIFSASGHLSVEAKAHINFVTEIIATGMETAIFAYLGFFLFSHRYHWNLFHMIISIAACCVSRAIMIPSLGLVANWITRLRQRRDTCLANSAPMQAHNRQQYGVIVDKKMQYALWFAGLRGAMSFALVEHIPLYDSTTGEGTRLKPELKAMTSASIMFTVFVMGGYTNYVFQGLGITPNKRRSGNYRTEQEMTPLVNGDDGVEIAGKDTDGTTHRRVPHISKESSTVA